MFSTTSSCRMHLWACSNNSCVGTTMGSVLSLFACVFGKIKRALAVDCGKCINTWALCSPFDVAHYTYTITQFSLSLSDTHLDTQTHTSTLTSTHTHTRTPSYTPLGLYAYSLTLSHTRTHLCVWGGGVGIYGCVDRIVSVFVRACGCGIKETQLLVVKV